ncbi:MAG: NAD-glutamate dehydrogenase [Nakamurella sp.]
MSEPTGSTAPADVLGNSRGNGPGELQASVDLAAIASPPDAMLIRAYFRRVAAEDQPSRSGDIVALIAAHRRLAASRSSGEVLISSYNPQSGDDGWGGTSTVIDIVNDDMPFLVGSVVAALSVAGLTVHRVIHPILAVRRDSDGALIDVVGEYGPGTVEPDARPESWMHLLVDRMSDEGRLNEILARVRQALELTRAVVTDAAAIADCAKEVAHNLRSAQSFNSAVNPQSKDGEAADLLDWMSAGNVTFLGYRSRRGPEIDGADTAEAGDGSRYGLLRPELQPSLGTADGTLDLPLPTGEFAVHQLWLDTALSRGQATLLVSVAESGDSTGGVSEFLVGLTPSARSADITTVPVLRRVVRQVLTHIGAAPDSYSGQRALEALSDYPRAELFWASLRQVTDVVSGQLQMSNQRQVQAFLQPDPQGHYTSVLVFLPRDRYTTAQRLAMQRVLMDTFHGVAIRYTAHISDALLASVHFTVATEPTATSGTAPNVDIATLNRDLRHSVRRWEDHLAIPVGGGDDDLDAAGALSRYADAFDEAYKEDYTVSHAVEDLKRLDEVSGPDDLVIAIGKPSAGASGDSRLKLYVADSTVSLSQVMPILQSMGVHVIDERPYEVRRTDGTLSRIYDFGLAVGAERRVSGQDLVDAKRRFSAAFNAAWHGWSEVDGFEALVLAARLEWREIAVLRAYAKYLRQIGSAYTQGYMEQVLAQYPTVTANLAALFATRFDPALPGTGRDARCHALTAEITAELDQVSSLDADRIVRTFLQLINATVRTNAYRAANLVDGMPHLAFKLDPHRVPGIPKPVPAHEIWVYSPRVEGVHLRFGAVARGGLRWSDRPEDFRTEVLGLVKAQEVKNAIIVPVGAKGGFVLKRPPAPTGDAGTDRDAVQAEGIESYKIFVAGLLDLTDNRVGDAIVPPDGVVRYDDDDPYMVVAADKGTARFSDIANAVSAQYGYWLGDAFASGGSAGYDHKGMGITARGAWESVKHHFRELGVDVQNQDFTCVGIGDMSGDVFGNGMLQSPHIKLVAAFDHRHVFVDPDPDCVEGFAERQRLFDLPRSSWGDYRPELISAGGGVWSRSVKSIPISAQMRTALGIADDVMSLTPTDLIRAILLSQVDLLWNGGIGTYIKSSTETHAEVGNKANDSVRVDGDELRVKVVGEGGNLGVTQLGRIEYSKSGGKINTDAIDNSAGVDTSDHEVNIKIAMQPLVASAAVSLGERNELLAQMTDHVAELVLADNKAQNRLLGVSRHHAGPMLSVHARQIDALVADGHLDRDLEFLPSSAEIDERIASGSGLTSPELAVLIAYTKSHLSRQMLATDLPASPAYRQRAVQYFPPAMGERFADVLVSHPLAREIVTTMTVNEVVNQAGISYAFRLGEETAAPAVDAIRAFTVVSSVFGLPELVGDIDLADHEVPAACQDHMTLLVRRLLDRATRWFLAHRPQPLEVSAEIERYGAAVDALMPKLAELLDGVEQDNVTRDVAELMEMGATQDLAERATYSLHSFSVLDIADVAEESGRDLVETATLYYALSAHLDFDHLLTEVSNLPRGDRWHALARQAVRDDLYRSLRLITADVLSTTGSGSDASSKIAQWEQQNSSRLTRARMTLAEIDQAGAGDLAALSVAAREIRSVIRQQ